MCRGLSSAERAQLGIPEGERGAAAFAYLAKSGCLSIPGTDDARDFQEVKNAMATVGIDASGQAQIWQLLAGGSMGSFNGLLQLLDASQAAAFDRYGHHRHQCLWPGPDLAATGRCLHVIFCIDVHCRHRCLWPCPNISATGRWMYVIFPTDGPGQLLNASQAAA